MSHDAFVQLFPITQQSHAFSKPSRKSPIAASNATNIKNVIIFVCQCKSTTNLIVRTVSHLVPVIHMQLPQANASVTSSHQPHMDRQRSTLHLRGKLEIEQITIKIRPLLVVRMTKLG